MYPIPSDPKKIKARIRRYERLLRKEYEKFGLYNDGYGKRYLIGPLHMVLGDLPGALASFDWYERTFMDDSGDALQLLCWAVALYRSGNLTRASDKLFKAMMSNKYLLPYLLGMEQEKPDISDDKPDLPDIVDWMEMNYVEEIPAQIWALWDEPALQWARETYHSPKFRQVWERYTEINE